MGDMTSTRGRGGRPLRASELLVSATGAVILVEALSLLAPDLPVVGIAAAALLLVVGGLLYRRQAPPAPTCIALIGMSRVADALARDLAGSRTVHLVGRVGPVSLEPSDELWLGTVADLRRVLESHRIDLLVLSDSVPRLEVFDAIERSCCDLPVRLSQLSDFYEKHFKHVPIASINSAWFQWLLHPRHRVDTPPLKRAFDVIVCVVLLVVMAPGILFAAALVRLDGGPAFYRQLRIGERGRPFNMLKLRTMDHRCEDSTSWTRADDDRVTRVGRFLRRTHIDELPQLLNVLRGQMSIVGPRPEQPQYVARLEQTLPFYSRRHQVRPGITGWAQIHCGYAGSDRGTAMKLSYDLYYLKNRSLVMDLRILLRTALVPFEGDQFAEPAPCPLIFGIPEPRSPQLEPSR